MTAGFSFRKIKERKTLGQLFKKKRARLKLSLVEAEIATKIRSKYLEALENDDYLNLPADAYTKGFVVRYAAFLGLNENESLEFFLFEKSKYKSDNSDFILPKKNLKEFKFIITPKFFIPILAGLVVLATISYIIYQIYGFAAAPELSIASPENNAVVSEDLVQITGSVTEGSGVFVNGNTIQVSDDGKFSADYKLSKGANVITVLARNKANKEKSLTYTVEYKQKTAQVSEGVAQN